MICLQTPSFGFSRCRQLASKPVHHNNELLDPVLFLRSVAWRHWVRTVSVPYAVLHVTCKPDRTARVSLAQSSKYPGCQRFFRARRDNGGHARTRGGKSGRGQLGRRVSSNFEPLERGRTSGTRHPPLRWKVRALFRISGRVWEEFVNTLPKVVGFLRFPSTGKVDRVG